MSHQLVFAAINQMVADGVIDRYAIGGAVGATFYLEPVATLDIDVFVAFQTPAAQPILSPKPIYDYLLSRGARIQGEYLIIGEWPVQFLPSTGPLVDEALSQALRVEVDHEPVWVFTAEHLAAIALETGRAKDKARLLQFVEAGVLDSDRLEGILSRHDLVDRWRTFERQYLEEQR
jgi:hypothetical protein